MRALHTTLLPGLRVGRFWGAGVKGMRILVCLGLLLLLAASASPSLSAEYSHSVDSIVQSGGPYVLTLNPVQEAQPSGYLLLEAAPDNDPGSGCCCKVCLPIIKR